MFTVLTWNVENPFQPGPSEQADFDAKLTALADVIAAAQPDAVALQEIGDEASFGALRARLGENWTGVLSTHLESPHTIRVGWLSRRPLTDVQEVIDLPAALAPVKVDDDGTALTQLGRGALAVTCSTHDGAEVRALTAHPKSKLLSFPGGRFDTTDEDERVRYGVYALNRRAAEAAAVREWATAALAGPWADRPLLVGGDLNDTQEAATTQLLFGPPGSQYGTGGYAHPDRGDRQRLWAAGYWMTGSTRAPARTGEATRRPRRRRVGPASPKRVKRVAGLEPQARPGSRAQISGHGRRRSRRSDESRVASPRRSCEMSDSECASRAER